MHRTNAVLRFAVVVALATLSLSGCRDSTAPDRSIRVYVALTNVDGPLFGSDVQGYPTIECDPYFRAVVTGEGSASWRDAKVRWFWGVDRTRPIDSTTISASDIYDSWGRVSLVPPDTLNSAWTFTAPAPFAAEFVYTYQPVGGQVRSDSVKFTCGPAVTPGTPGPTVEPPTTNAASGKVQPGDTIRLSYSATAAATLWETVVRLAGACSAEYLHPARLAPSVTRTDTLLVPADCLIGQPLGITVYAVDAGGRVAAASPATALSVLDTTPPTLSPVLATPRYVSATANTFSSTLFVGDTLGVAFRSRDNSAVSMLYWEETVSGKRDSLWAPLGDQARIPMPPEWVGQPLHFRFWVTDRAGLTSDTVSTTPGAITVAPIVTRPVTTAQIAGDFAQMAYDAARQRVYVAQRTSKRIAVLSLPSLALVDSIPLPDLPISLDLTPGGDSLVVLLPASRTLAVIDLRAATPAASTVALTALDTLQFQSAGAVRVMANDKALIGLGNAYPTEPTVLELDLTTGVQRLRTDAARGGFSAYSLARSGDAGVAVINEGCLQRYTASSDTFSPCASPAPWRTLTLSATGAGISLGFYILDGSLAVQRVLAPLYPEPPDGYDPGTAISADGATLYVLDWSLGVVRYRTSDGVVVDAVANAATQPAGILATADGRWVLTFHSLAPTSFITAISMQ